MIEQSIATMTMSELESLITKLIDQRVSQSKLSNTNTIERDKLVEEIHSLQGSLKEKYGDFPDSTELLQHDRSR
jgi:hypothetical protein